MQRVRLPDGRYAQFPDDMPREEIRGILSRKFPPSAARADAPQDQTAQSAWARVPGRALRAAATGLGGIADFVASPVRGALNLGNQALGGSGDYFKPVTPQIQAGLDAMGVSRPVGAGEEIADAAAAALAGGAVPIAGGARLAQAATGAFSNAPTAMQALQAARAGGASLGSQAGAALGAIPARLGNAFTGNTAKAVYGALAEAPLLQGVSAGTGAAASEAARIKGAGPVEQIAAGLGAGLAPGLFLAAPAMARGAAVAPRGFTQGGRERVAGELLAGRYERGNALADDIERLLPDAEIIPGSRPTTAQLTQDRGASGLELGFLSKDSGNRALNQRYQQQEDARRALLEPIQEEAQLRRTQIGQDAEAAQAAARGGAGEVDRLASAPGRTMRGGEDVLGMEIRDAFDANYFGAQSQTNAAYDRARELNEGVIYNQEPLLASFRNIVGRGRHRQETAEMRKMIDTMAEATENGQSYSYEDMQNLRKELSGLRQVERAQGGNPELARKYGQMLEKVDDFLEGNTDALAGTAPRPQPGSPAYREATGFARDAVRSDPYYDDLQYLMQQGIRPESVISLIGQDGMRELNRVAPGLVRKSGTLELDNVASDLGGSGTYGYGSGWNEQSNGQALLDNLIDRLGPGRGRIRADTARLRDEYLSGQAQGHLGPTAEGRAATLQAKELRRIQGERFERGANERLSQKTGKSLEGKGIEVAKVPNLFFRPGPAGTDAANAFWRSSGKSEQARTAIEDYAISQLKSAAANADGSLNMDKWRSWMDGHAAALRKFPELRDKLNTARKAQQAIADAATAAEEAVGRATAGAKVAGIDNEMGLAQKVHSPLTEGGKKALRESGLFSEKDVDIITRARADYRRKLGVQSAGSVPGSRTALNQSTGSAIAEMAGNATALSRMPFVGRMVEATVGRVFKSQADAIEQLLLDATLDPSFAASLLRKATPGRLESVTRRLNDIARRYMNQGYTPGQVQMGVNVQQNSEE